MEYWSLEQAKLGKSAKSPMEGKVIFITGGASGIGFSCALTFGTHIFLILTFAINISKKGKAGGSVFIVDVNQENLDKALKELKSQKVSVSSLQTDVTK